MKTKAQTAFLLPPRRTVRLGFVALTDCAPLVMAQELGLFKQYGVRVALQRELGWATTRDKIIYRELDAAHAPAAMPIAATLGLGSIPCDCVTALVLNVHGNAITLSRDLWNRGVRDGEGLRAEINKARREKTFTFGAVFPFSSHRHLLRNWLVDHGIALGEDARIVIVPPPQMVANLKAGNLDGFCVGEPWNSVAAQTRVGWTVAVSARLDPGHPEKVLMVRREFAESRAEEHVALVAALLEAAKFCDQTENHEQIAATLARPEFVNAPVAALRRGLRGELGFGDDSSHHHADFCIFNRDGTNEPSPAKAEWALELIRHSGLCADPARVTSTLGARVFRSDIYHQAVHLLPSISTSFEHEIETENQLTCV